MYVTYTPSGDVAQEFVFVPDDVNTFDAEAVESATGWTWDEFLMNLQKGSMKGRRALLWILLRKVHRGLQMRDVSFTNREVKVEYDQTELAELIKNTEELPDDTEGKSKTLEFLSREYDKSRPGPSESGKALDGTTDTDTPLPLLK